MPSAAVPKLRAEVRTGCGVTGAAGADRTDRRQSRGGSVETVFIATACGHLRGSANLHWTDPTSVRMARVVEYRSAGE
jgi:hypothetical protein